MNPPMLKKMHHIMRVLHNEPTYAEIDAPHEEGPVHDGGGEEGQVLMQLTQHAHLGGTGTRTEAEFMNVQFP
jgi:hypothetical protein